MYNAVKLSDREKQIIKYRAAGLAYKEIASQLGISLGTVKTHFNRVFQKLDVRSSIDLLQRVHQDDCERCVWRRRKRV